MIFSHLDGFGFVSVHVVLCSEVIIFKCYFYINILEFLVLFSVYMKYSLLAKSRLFACSHPGIVVFLTYWKCSMPNSVLDLVIKI